MFVDEHSRIVLKRELEGEDAEVWISRSNVEKVEENGFINASYISVSSLLYNAPPVDIIICNIGIRQRT